MIYLLSTDQTQGQRESDFCWTPPGELLRLPSVCGKDKDIDGPCGCRRSMMGISSGTGTTTMVVSETHMSKDMIEELIRDAYEDCEVEYRENVLEIYEQIKDIPEGTVVELRDCIVGRRPEQPNDAFDFRDPDHS